MQNKSRAFTLIELLVVVLIIGILAAVAVPQYQKAVERARMVEGITQVRTLAEAEKRYLLANGEYATVFSDLDITVTGTPSEQYGDIIVEQKNFHLSLVSSAPGSVVWAQYKHYEYQNGNYYILYHIPTDKMYCGGYKTDTKSNAICKTFGTTPIDCPNNADVNCYPIQ